MRPCLKESTLPHRAVGVFVTNVAHNRHCAGQRNSCRKFRSRKRRNDQDDYSQFQEEIGESLPEKGMVLKRLDVLDLVLERAQLESGQHE